MCSAAAHGVKRKAVALAESREVSLFDSSEARNEGLVQLKAAPYPPVLSLMEFSLPEGDSLQSVKTAFQKRYSQPLRFSLIHESKADGPNVYAYSIIFCVYLLAEMENRLSWTDDEASSSSNTSCRGGAFSPNMLGSLLNATGIQFKESMKRILCVLWRPIDKYVSFPPL